MQCKDISDFEVALEILNQISNERGVSFKKNTQKQNRQVFSLEHQSTP